MKKILLFALILAAAAIATAATSCVDRKPKQNDAETDTATASETDVYTMPQMPGMITEPADRARWAGQHYWDNFRWADTTLVGSRKTYTEQAFVDYIQLLRNMPQEIVNESISTLFKKAAADKTMFLHIAEVAEKYLYDANSPYRNDEYYVAVLEGVTANPALDKWELIRPNEQLILCRKNRVGHTANDFRYTVASGATRSMSALRTPFTLLFFNNPGCPSCAITLEQLKNSQYLMALVEAGTLAILAIYPDEDLSGWRDHAKEFPANWINGYDKSLTIKTKELYDLKAIPTMYLLDDDKKVMLKDVMSISEIEHAIYSNITE